MWRGVGLIVGGGLSGAALMFLEERSLVRCAAATTTAPSTAEPNVARAAAAAARLILPKQIILVRHGESEGNADHTLYRTKADNLVELTPRGSAQAVEAGTRIRSILDRLGASKVGIFTSPFERTLQTTRNVRLAVKDLVEYTYVEPDIREQEFGNLQDEDFIEFRAEQQRVGRFWYRFPTGESGSDVYSRVKLWWNTSVLDFNLRPGYEEVDTLVVVTHGLTMRLILMQLFGWSPQTFHTVWNAGNCDCYVLRLDLTEKGRAPYVLDASLGEIPRSTANITAHFVDGSQRDLKLNDYLSLPQPRTRQFQVARIMLAEQYGLRAEDITRIDFFSGRTGYHKDVSGPSKFR